MKSDRDTFALLVEPHRRELQLHCYRMLGSFHEAEDLVQETLIRAWRAIDRFEERTSLRGWLYKIATHTCLNALASRARRVMPHTEGPPNSEAPLDIPATEVAWLEPYPDAALEGIADTAPGPEERYALRESVELAFVIAIQYLPPRQRAALLLCDVMGWSAAESAGLLETSPASVNSLLQRARATLSRQSFGGQRAPTPDVASAADERQRALVARYILAWERCDLDGFAALLKEDAVLSMPPWRQWFRGRTAIQAFFAGAWSSSSYDAFRLVPTAANRQPACAVYSRAPEASEFRAHSIHVFTLDSDAIAVLMGFIDPPLFAAFGLPSVLPLHN